MIRKVFAKATPDFEYGPAFHSATTAAERLSILIERSVRLFAEYPALHRLMTLEGHQPSDRLIWLCDTYIAENDMTVCEMIADGQREARSSTAPPQLRMAITAMEAVPFSVSAEYQYLTRHNPFAKNEIEGTIALIKKLIFKAG